MKDTRETLYKIGNQGITFNNFEMLYQPRPGAEGEFRIGRKETVDQLLYVLLCSLKPISTNNLKQKFSVNEDLALSLDPLIFSLSSQKIPDMFTALTKILDYYRQRETSEKYLSSHKDGITPKELEFYRSVLGFSWVWIRLLILKHSLFNFEQYEKEMNQFVDQVELEHHQANQNTIEALEFTFNALKYVQKLAKKETFPLSFPLNYMLH